VVVGGGLCAGLLSRLHQVDEKSPGAKSVSGTGFADFNGIGRDSTLNGEFARMDLHGASGTTCEFWGMITP